MPASCAHHFHTPRRAQPQPIREHPHPPQAPGTGGHTRAHPQACTPHTLSILTHATRSLTQGRGHTHSQAGSQRGTRSPAVLGCMCEQACSSKGWEPGAWPVYPDRWGLPGWRRVSGRPSSTGGGPVWGRPRDSCLGDAWWPCRGPWVRARAACLPRVGACVSAWFPFLGSLLDSSPVAAGRASHFWLQFSCLVRSAQGRGDLSL